MKYFWQIVRASEGMDASGRGGGCTGKVYSINELRNIGNNASKDAACPDAEDIATIIFTSGTTGKSKGVMLTQKNLASNVEAVKFQQNREP